MHENARVALIELVKRATALEQCRLVTPFDGRRYAFSAGCKGRFTLRRLAATGSVPAVGGIGLAIMLVALVTAGGFVLRRNRLNA